MCIFNLTFKEKKMLIAELFYDNKKRSLVLK